jgi:MSHA biogenesis protein MshK
MSRVALLALGLFASASAYCASFTDPFRPPREMEAPVASASAPAGPRLESVLIAPDRRIAVINGQQYSEGAAFGEGRVLRISETEVVIRRSGRDEALKLYPQEVRRASGSADEGR